MGMAHGQWSSRGGNGDDALRAADAVRAAADAARVCCCCCCSAAAAGAKAALLTLANPSPLSIAIPPNPANNSEARMKQEKRTPYSRHYALKGRGRKEQLRFENKGDRTELVPTRASVGV